MALSFRESDPSAYRAGWVMDPSIVRLLVVGCSLRDPLLLVGAHGYLLPRLGSCREARNSRRTPRSQENWGAEQTRRTVHPTIEADERISVARRVGRHGATTSARCCGDEMRRCSASAICSAHPWDASSHDDSGDTQLSCGLLSSSGHNPNAVAERTHGHKPQHARTKGRDGRCRSIPFFAHPSQLVCQLDRELARFFRCHVSRHALEKPRVKPLKRRSEMVSHEGAAVVSGTGHAKDVERTEDGTRVSETALAVPFRNQRIG
jgi:hypothetical protein